MLFGAALFCPIILITAKNIISRKHGEYDQKKPKETVMDDQHHQHPHRETKQCKSNDPFHKTTKKAYIPINICFPVVAIYLFSS